MSHDNDNNPDENSSAAEILSEEVIREKLGGRPDTSQLNFFAIQFSEAIKGLEFYFDTLQKSFKDQDIFEENLKASFIVSLLTCLEFYLIMICKISGPKDAFKKLIDKPGFPYKYRVYLSEHPKFNVESLEWDKIKMLWLVRNAFAHNDGYCLKKNGRLEELRKFVDDIEGISMENLGTNAEPHYLIRVDPSFCKGDKEDKGALGIVKKFGSELGKLIRDHPNIS